MMVAILFLFVLLMVALGIALTAQQQCRNHADHLRQLSAQILRLQYDLMRLQTEAQPPVQPVVRTAEEEPTVAAMGVDAVVPDAMLPETPALSQPVMEAVAMPAVALPQPEQAVPRSNVLPGAGVPPPLPVAATMNRPTAPLPLPRTQAKSPPPPASAAEPWDWEQFFGARLLSWVGGLVLFLAVAFFVKLSFERGWVSPPMRAGAGALLGVGLIGGGIWLRNGRSRTTGLTLVGTGLLVLYGVTYACHSVYEFPVFTLPVTFACMTAVTVLALVLSLGLDALSVAVLGIAAGFLTPVLLSTGKNNPGALFGYVALLDVGLLTVMWRKRWDVLALLGSFGTVLMQYGWYFKYATPDQIGTILAVLVGFGAAFTAVLGLAQRAGQTSRELELAVAGLVMSMLGIAFVQLMNRGMMQHTGAYFLLIGCADVLALLISWMSQELRRVQSIVSGIVFFLLAVWSAVWLNAGTTGWALGMTVGFGLLHTGFGLIKKPGEETRDIGLGSQLIPALCLLVLFAPLVQELDMPWTFWPAVVVMDVAAIVVAFLSGSLLALALVLLLSLGVAGVWLNSPVGSAGDLSESLVVIGGYAVLFYGAGCALMRSTRLAQSGTPENVRARIPAMAALFPFLLLNMVTLKLVPANPTPVFAVALFLGVLSLGWAWWRGEGKMALTTLFLVFLTQAGWLLRVGTPSAWGAAVAWNMLFYAVFIAFPFVARRRCEASRAAWTTGAISGPLHFLLIYWLVRKLWPDANWLGAIPVAFAIPTALLAWQSWRTLPAASPVRLHSTAWFGAMTLLFVTVALPIQFQRQVLTLALALEGLALVGLFRKLPHPGLRDAGVYLLVAAFVRLTLNPAVLEYTRSGVVLWNWYLCTYGTATVCLFLAARWLGTSEAKSLGISARPLLNTLGTILAFALVNLEIADAFATGTRLTFELSGSFARGLSFTVAWALFAFGLLVVGLRRAIAPSRYAGLALMGVTLLKLLLVDTARLDQVYRIVAFAAVAVVSILASFLYQRIQRGSGSVFPDKSAEK